jgi:hypothetical protein
MPAHHKPSCLVCKLDMEIGFLTDQGHGGILNLPRWCPGEPKPGFLFGEVKSAQLKEGLKVTAYRCPGCQALRLYAFDSTEQH